MLRLFVLYWNSVFKDRLYNELVHKNNNQ